MSEQAAGDGGEERGPNPSTNAGACADSNASPPSGPSPLFRCANGHAVEYGLRSCPVCFHAWQASTFPVFPVQ